jgi:hypothetical protein
LTNQSDARSLMVLSYQLMAERDELETALADPDTSESEAAKIQEKLSKSIAGALGASSLCPSSLIPTTPATACQSARDPTEPDTSVSTCKAQAEGTVLIRRSLMNKIVAVSAAVAIPTAAPDGFHPTADEKGRVSNPYEADACQIGRDFGTELSRLEQAIHVFRTRYICEGWKMDEMSAQSALDYYKKDDEKALISFCGQHGISLDWILMGDPTVLICRSAAQSRAAFPSDLPILTPENDAGPELREAVSALHEANDRLVETHRQRFCGGRDISGFPKRTCYELEYDTKEIAIVGLKRELKTSREKVKELKGQAEAWRRVTSTLRALAGLDDEKFKNLLRSEYLTY